MLPVFSSVREALAVRRFFGFSLDFYYAPQFVLGRYNKFARDVPQSPWCLTPMPLAILEGLGKGKAPRPTEGEDWDGGDEEDRKGRQSVQEIVASFFHQETACVSCAMHGCGREDIDVRCLGNGRPFALQIVQARRRITQQLLDRVTFAINAHEGRNELGDIRVSLLSPVSRQLPSPPSGSNPSCHNPTDQPGYVGAHAGGGRGEAQGLLLPGLLRAARHP